jgi:hypothetical protein
VNKRSNPRKEPLDALLLLDPGVDVLLLGKPGEVDVVEDGDGYPGGRVPAQPEDKDNGWKKVKSFLAD